MGSLDEVGLGAELMKTHGYTKGWGVGRHVLGSNYFYYVQDPWGSWAEYSFDIDFVPADVEWPAADHPPEDSFYIWGPAVPDDFVINHEQPGAALSALVVSIEENRCVSLHSNAMAASPVLACAWTRSSSTSTAVGLPSTLKELLQQGAEGLAAAKRRPRARKRGWPCPVFRTCRLSSILRRRLPSD